jgi:5-(carboxyamino)imidazole ribonucleotide synthase
VSNGPLPIGARIGILGTGQLGRMLALAAAQLGFDVAIYGPETDAPASRVAAHTTQGDFEDRDAVIAFGKVCDVVTYEFENVPAEAALAVEASGTPLRPGKKALEVSQDRLVEKDFLNATGIQTVAYRSVSNEAELGAALDALGGKGILKTRRFGYDGKGQIRVAKGDNLTSALEKIGNYPAILEAIAPFDRELSVIAARGLNGNVQCFALTENEHRSQILHRSTAPAHASNAVTTRAHEMAERLLVALDYVGVLALELFELPDGQLIANEMAPRVHNSGHWTMDAGPVSQFEQHIRAVAGWPLVHPNTPPRIEMINLIGDDVDQCPTLAADPAVRLHLYGKREARPGRKMGHFNRLLD